MWPSQAQQVVKISLACSFTDSLIHSFYNYLQTTYYVPETENEIVKYLLRAYGQAYVGAGNTPISNAMYPDNHG